MSKRKLSSKESKELVTKGYLEEVLESKNYVTKGYFYDTLEKVLESKDYATNDRLDMVIEEVASLKVQVTEFREESFRHMSALMEDNRHQFRLFMEAFEARFERIERKVFG